MADSTISVAMAAVFLYCSSFLVGLLLNNIVDKWLPEPVRQYGFDYLKTMVICAYPFGHAILWKYFGGSGFLCGMVPVMLLTIFVLPKGEGTPISTWIKYFSGVLPLRQCLLKTAIHMSAGLAAYQLGILLLQSRLNWHCILKLREHEDGTCKSTLNVSVLKGLIVESLGVMYDLWFSTKTFSENKFVDAFIKVANTGIVVITGFRYTGMFMHPAKATAHTYGCGETSTAAHLIVYWLGPVLGAWLFVRYVHQPKQLAVSQQ